MHTCFQAIASKWIISLQGSQYGQNLPKMVIKRKQEGEIFCMPAMVQSYH